MSSYCNVYITEKPKYKIVTPHQTKYIFQGEPIGSLKYMPGDTSFITRLDNYFYNGNVIDVNTYVPTSDIELTPSYSLTQTSCSVTVTCGSYYEEPTTGTVATSSSKGYYYFSDGSSLNYGKISGSLFGQSVTDFHVEYNTYKNGTMLSPGYYFYICTHLSDIVLTDIKITLGSPFNKSATIYKGGSLYHLFWHESTSSTQYNYMTGTKTFTL